MDAEFDETEELRKELSKLNSVREMTTQPGWRVVCEHFSKVIGTIQERLAIEEDFKKIRRLQERLRAFRAMLETVDALCSQYSEFTARLEDIDTDLKERVQYGLDS